MARRIHHPSGRPIREREDEKALGWWRRPRDGFLSPGLHVRELVSAIGFHHVREDEYGNEED